MLAEFVYVLWANVLKGHQFKYSIFELIEIKNSHYFLMFMDPTEFSGILCVFVGWFVLLLFPCLD